jgi:hypothetical protein
LRTRGSLKPLSGREGALKPHFYVRFKIRDIKVNKNDHADGFRSGFGQFPSIPAALRAYKHQNRSPVAVLRSRFFYECPLVIATSPIDLPPSTSPPQRSNASRVTTYRPQRRLCQRATPGQAWRRSPASRSPPPGPPPPILTPRRRPPPRSTDRRRRRSAPLPPRRPLALRSARRSFACRHHPRPGPLLLRPPPSPPTPPLTPHPLAPAPALRLLRRVLS